MRCLPFALAALVLPALPAAAQTRQPPRATIAPPPERIWTEIRGVDSCSAETAATPSEPQVTITQPRGGAPILALAGQAWTSRIDGPVAIVIRRLYEEMPVTLTGLARSNTDGSGATIEIAGFQPADLGDDLTVRSGPAKLALGTAGTRGAYRAAAWIGRCLTELERTDPGSGAPFAVPPRLTVSPVTESDYPPAALRSVIQGRVVLDITISAQGLVSRCDVGLSSGYTMLDEVSCPAVSRRAIFVPALDVEGRPTEAAVKLPIVWKIPD